MSSGAPLEIVDVATAHVPATSKDFKDEHIFEKRESLSSTIEDLVGPNGEQYPTEQEWTTLRRVYGKVNWMIYVIGIVEMCERFAYYGTTAVCECTVRPPVALVLTYCGRQLHSTIITN
jgi:POT family proton-dependent oligopeptide transporter